MNPDVAAILRELDSSHAPRVHRFDGGVAFRPRVAVLPSAFNPPTRAHLRMLKLARQVEGISAVAALLSTRNVEKSVFGASLADRVGMLLALHEGENAIGVLAANAARIPDQAEALRTAHPGAAFDFVVGYDTLIRIFQPRYYEDMERDLARFFAGHRLIAMNRGEASLADVEQFLETAGVRDFASRIVACQLEDEPASMSSTGARAGVAGGDATAIIPDAVMDYVRRRGLYLGDDDASAPT